MFNTKTQLFLYIRVASGNTSGGPDFRQANVLVRPTQLAAVAFSASIFLSGVNNWIRNISLRLILKLYEKHTSGSES